MKILLTCLGIAALLLAGCSTVEKDKRANALQAATNGYQAALRWGYYDTALAFLDPQTPPPTINFKGLRLTGYDVMQSLRMPDKATALQTVSIEYLYEDRQVVKQLTDQQRWRWDAAHHAWFLQSGLPKFETR
ncbi:hypothetical protein [Chromatium okenii]|uniref:hypothetical protein n=1 Tax=Chromatium okenii TaxID=61644 RepID=UPI001F5B7DC8|nr:hypothetical protein [Chromatium okenii]